MVYSTFVSDMIVQLDRFDLIALVKGKTPDFSEFEHELCVKAGIRYFDHSGKTEYSNLNELTDSELWKLYLLSKNSWEEKTQVRKAIIKKSPSK